MGRTRETGDALWVGGSRPARCLETGTSQNVAGPGSSAPATHSIMRAAAHAFVSRQLARQYAQAFFIRHGVPVLV